MIFPLLVQNLLLPAKAERVCLIAMSYPRSPGQRRTRSHNANSSLQVYSVLPTTTADLPVPDPDDGSPG
jgi:hypothetical protein